MSLENETLLYEDIGIYRSDNPRLRAEYETSSAQIYQLLQDPETQFGIMHLMPSVRRIAHVYRVRDFPPLDRVPDIVFDINSFHGWNLSETEILHALKSVQKLIYSYYNVADLKAKYVRTAYHTVDLNERTEVAHHLLEEGVWRRWKAPQTSIGEQVLSFHKRALTELLFLPYALQEINSGKVNIDSVGEGELLNKSEPGYADSSLGQEWLRDIVADLPLFEIFKMVGQLSPTEKKVVLKHMGYYNPELTINNFLIAIHRSKRSYHQHLQSVKTKFRKMKESLFQITFPETSIKVTIEETNNQFVWRSEGLLLRPSAARVALAESHILDDPDLMTKITDLEYKVLVLAMEHDHGDFTYSSKAIADKLGIPTLHKVNLILQRVLMYSGQERYLTSDDRTINSRSKRFDLISNRVSGQTSEEKIDVLNYWQREIYDLLTVPQGDKHLYLTRKEIKKALLKYEGSKSLSKHIGEIWHLLNIEHE